MLKPELLDEIIANTIAQEKLPQTFAASAQAHFLPLCERILARHRQLNRPLLVGINGAQGTGKTTLALLLKRLLQAQNVRCVVLSIDDLYLTLAEREALAATVHPLLRTRGVPGTHDLAMGLQVVTDLLHATPASRTAIPHFDKARDNRSPAHQWLVHEGPVDVVILEGWCVGVRPVDLSGAPMNDLEQEHDPDGWWRAYVETKLHDYQRLFSQLDLLFMLKAPSMQCIIEWRSLQEEKLRERVEASLLKDGSPTSEDAPNKGIMNARDLHWFIMHYERLTRAMLAHMPAYADAVCELNADHSVARTQMHALTGAIS